MPFLPKGDGNVGGRSSGTRMQNFREYKPKSGRKPRNNTQRPHRNADDDSFKSPKSSLKRKPTNDDGGYVKKQRAKGDAKTKQEFKPKTDDQKVKKVKKYRGKNKNKIKREEIKPSARPQKGFDLWLALSKFGSVVKSTPFIVFKLPLIKPMNGPGLLLLEQQFKLEQLFEAHPKIGLIVDLTGSGGGYEIKFDKQVFEYQHIKCPARYDDDLKKVEEFITKCSDFIAKNPDKLIGVHDFTGTRSTALMIIKYMEQELGFSLNDAIDSFESARGETIFEMYKTNLTK